MPDTPIDVLARFDIPGIVRCAPGAGGLPRLEITHPAAAGEMYLHGSHVTRWQPCTAEPVLFMSGRSRFEPNQPIRGGIPICFPWFGPKAHDPAAPAHGLARTRTWQLTDTASDDSGASVEMACIIEPFRLTCRATFGAELTLALRVENAGDASASFEEALHTYLRVGDVRQVEVTGLRGATYIDKLDAGRRHRQDADPLRIAGEIDRVYLDSAADCVVRDPSLNRSLRVAKTGSNATVVWNPWIDKARRMADFGDDEWPTMLCIESANVADGAVELAAGATHEMTATLSVE